MDYKDWNDVVADLSIIKHGYCYESEFSRTYNLVHKKYHCQGGFNSLESANNHCKRNTISSVTNSSFLVTYNRFWPISSAIKSDTRLKMIPNDIGLFPNFTLNTCCPK